MSDENTHPICKVTNCKLTLSHKGVLNHSTPEEVGGGCGFYSPLFFFAVIVAMIFLTK